MPRPRPAARRRRACQATPRPASANPPEPDASRRALAVSQAHKRRMRPTGFTCGVPSSGRGVERETRRRLRALQRSIGTDIARLRADAPTSIAHLAEVAGLDRSFVGRVESGAAHPSLETLVALSVCPRGGPQRSLLPRQRPEAHGSSPVPNDRIGASAARTHVDAPPRGSRQQALAGRDRCCVRTGRGPHPRRWRGLFRRHSPRAADQVVGGESRVHWIVTHHRCAARLDDLASPDPPIDGGEP